MQRESQPQRHSATPDRKPRTAFSMARSGPKFGSEGSQISMPRPCWLNVLISATFAFALSSCASVPIASTQLEQTAKKFNPPPGSAAIYIFRSKQIVGSAVLFNIRIDDKLTGRIAPGTFIYCTVKPGKHLIISSGGIPDKVASLEFDTGKGALCFLQVGPGWNGIKIEQINVNSGREKIFKLKASGDVVLESNEGRE